MKRILIADASKASLVMTSEVFKDHFPGVQVLVARTSAEAIETAKTCGPLDAFIIDFDLPDKDGAHTAAKLKKLSPTPVLITAFERPEVQSAIEKELSAYDDCLSWLKKPVKAELVVTAAQRFCEGKYRCQRRISCSIPSEMDFTLGAGGTRISIPATIEDSSLGGVKLRLLLDKVSSTEKAQALTAVSHLNLGASVQYHLPAWENFTGTGATASENPSLEGAEVGPTGLTKTPRGKASTLSVLKATTKEALRKKPLTGPALKGKIAWMHSDETTGVVVLGVHSESVLLSKKLFETVRDMQAGDLPSPETVESAPLVPTLPASVAKPSRERGSSKAKN